MSIVELKDLTNDIIIQPKDPTNDVQHPVFR